jgi:hypothetical protein
VNNNHRRVSNLQVVSLEHLRRFGLHATPSYWKKSEHV